MDNERFDFLTDEPTPAIRALLRAHGLTMDEGFRGELTRLLDGPGLRRAYFRKRGLTIDGLGEMLWDRKITGRRLAPIEVLDVLELALVNQPAQKSRRPSSEAIGEIEQLARHATDSRHRKFQCSDCRQIARGTRKSDLVCGSCLRTALTRLGADLRTITKSDRLTLDVVRAIEALIPNLRRIDPLPEELLQQAAGERAAA